MTKSKQLLYVGLEKPIASYCSPFVKTSSLCVIRFHTETTGFQPQVLIMLAIIFLTLFLFAGKALVKRMLEKRRLKRKGNLVQSSQRYRIRTVSPMSFDLSVEESTAKPNFSGLMSSAKNNPVKNVTFETAETESESDAPPPWAW